MDTQVMFHALVTRLQKELHHLTTHWLEPWIALQEHHAAAAAAIDATTNSSTSTTCTTSHPASIQMESSETLASTPELVTLMVVHRIASLKAEGVLNCHQESSSLAPSLEAKKKRSEYKRVSSSITELEAFLLPLVPQAFQPLSLLIVNAKDDLEARETAARGLMELCDSTYLPAFQSANKSSSHMARQELQLYRKLKVELKKAFFTISIEISCWLRELMGWYAAADVARESVVAASSSSEHHHRPQHTTGVTAAPAAGGHAGNGGGILSRTLAAITSTLPDVLVQRQARLSREEDEDDDDEGNNQPAMMSRALSLVELPLDDEQAMEAYEAQRKEELIHITQQVRELRELQEYASTLTAEQDALLQSSREQAEKALDNATKSRMQLTLAAKYRVAGAALTGALVGGLLGGPIGLVAGAKSAATIGLAAIAGGATGSLVGGTVATTTASRSAAVDEAYETSRNL